MDLMPVRPSEDYAVAVGKLLPRGEFWDRQLADPNSDVSLWCQVKADELRRFKLRLAALFSEALVATATETLDDWERVAGVDNHKFSNEDRRLLLQQQKNVSVDAEKFQNLATLFGVKVLRLFYPYRPAMFGGTRFTSRWASPAALNLLHTHVAPPSNFANKAAFETAFINLLLANQTIHFFYEDEP